ncbi:MAG: glycosyltransferase family 2 protein [Bacteroides sp.]|nr:glycosyltransferase family 2 protein [Roseburia sp.]MCM1345876.1 glycosyltransferase family 2 protein [Bacteroides sp.]MCM1421993.1 glycosyltransferase family 2 protein [Bacteroides sp.]
MCKLAIVILNWNGKEMMRKYLPSVIECSDTEGVEIIVADNHSTDESVDMLHKCFPKIRIIVLDQNYGFAGGYNRALAEVEAEYYLLLNSDVEIRQRGWVKPMIEYMDRHPQTGACQPKLLSLTRPDEFEYAGGAGGFIDKYGYPFCRGRIFHIVEKDNGQYDDIVPLMWATGAALMVRAYDYWEAGGLDERFFAHMEEIDLCWRMRRLGKSVVCIPQSTAYHLGGATLSKENPKKTFLNFRNNLLMLYKNLPEKDLESVMHTKYWLDMLAACVFLLKGETGNFRAVWQARREFERIKNDFAEERSLNLSRCKLDCVPERKDFSILWKFYIGRCRTFKDLQAD